MSRWDERNIIKDDFNKAAVGQPEKEPEKPKDPELKPKPPTPVGPGGMGGGAPSAWERHHAQTPNQQVDKQTPQKENPALSKDFEKAAKGK